MSMQRLWPMMPASSLASASVPYGLCLAARNEDGSMEGQGGDHSGFTPVALSAISAMCPPSARTVTRSRSFSIETARRSRYLVSRIAFEQAFSHTVAPRRFAIMEGMHALVLLLLATAPFWEAK